MFDPQGLRCQDIQDTRKAGSWNIRAAHRAHWLSHSELPWSKITSATPLVSEQGYDIYIYVYSNMILYVIHVMIITWIWTVNFAVAGCLNLCEQLLSNSPAKRLVSNQRERWILWILKFAVLTWVITNRFERSLDWAICIWYQLISINSRHYWRRLKGWSNKYQPEWRSSYNEILTLPLASGV